MIVIQILIVTLVIEIQFYQTWTQQVESNPEVLVLKSIHSLQQSISYFTTRENKVAANELLGLRIATAALEKVVDNCVKSPDIYVPHAILESIKLLCAKLNVLIPRILNIYRPFNMTHGFKNFISSEWLGFLPYKSINVDKEDRKKLEKMNNIVPADFQLCLGDLPHISGKNCFISNNCFKVLQPKMAQESGFPYQAVILSILQLLGCSREVNEKWNPVTLESLPEDICYALYPKVSAFHASNIIQDEKDEVISFLDAFFSCSLFGFEDFLQVTHLRVSAILEWQLPIGCFGMAGASKEDAKNGGTCLPSMSSVAVGQIGLYLLWLMDPKGYSSSTGHQPFKETSWLSFLVKVVLLFLFLTLVLVRKVRRFFVGVVFTRLPSFFRSLVS